MNKQSLNINYYLPLLLLSTSFIFFSCNRSGSNQQAPEVIANSNTITLTEAQFKNAGIETGSPEMKTISSILKLNGRIDVPPQNYVSISAPLGGYLKTTRLLPGMHVSKGEVIAVLEDQQYIQLQQDYLTAKSQWTILESEYNRQKELNRIKASSDKVFEQSKAAFEAQDILLNALIQKLKLIGLNPTLLSASSISKSINILSPIDGFVSVVNVNIGKYVTPSDVLFELVNPEDIHLSLTVFDKDIDKLRIGQKLHAYTNNNPDKKYLCEIILISKNVTNDNATIVHCHFEQYDKSLLPGMFMNADVEISAKINSALPDEAIVRYHSKQYVFIDKGNFTYNMIEVHPGNSEAGYTEALIEGSSGIEKIVVKGAYQLLMALKNSSDEEE